MQPLRLYESLFILHKCNTTINRLWSIIEKTENRITEIEDYALLSTYHIKLEAVSFLDEFNGEFYTTIEPEYIERVKEVRQITSPIVKQIGKWKDLNKFRNNIIAHPWRHKGKFVIPDQQYYNVPRNWFECAILVNLLNYIWQIIKAEFESEFTKALVYIETLKPPIKPPTDYSKLNDEHYKMAEEVNRICNKLKKPYDFKVILYKINPKD